MPISRALPYLNFALATTSLGVQLCILYPWHEELDRSFERLSHDHARQLEEHHLVRMKSLEKLKEELSHPIASLARGPQQRGWLERLWRWEKDDLKDL